MTTRRVSALYIRRDGHYPAMVSDCWDVTRDARNYRGPRPVVAHPPCKRWGRYWWADGSTAPGDDGGLFRSALAMVHRYGGIIEHPAASHAWGAFGLPAATLGRWTRGGRGHATAVYQLNYGHPALKQTWLYVSGVARPPALDWRKPAAKGAYLAQPGRCSQEKPRRTCPCTRCERLFGAAWDGAHNRGVRRLTPRENELTPLPFADLLISIAARAKVAR